MALSPSVLAVSIAMLHERVPADGTVHAIVDVAEDTGLSLQRIGVIAKQAGVGIITKQVSNTKVRYLYRMPAKTQFKRFT